MAEDAIIGAARRLEGKIRRTPLVEGPADRLPVGVRLLLKLECDQISGSFKARGAHHFIDRLFSDSPEKPPQGVVTYSSGNHGRAVAEAAAGRGIRALITVPESIDRSKAAAIEAAGAELVIAGGTSESRKARALSIASERGWVVIPPFDHDWIIEGQATVAAEVLEECPEVTDLWAPVGGGGLAGGCALTLTARAPHVALHTVEPAGAPGYAASVAAGEHVTLESSSSIADGLLPLRIGERNWACLRRALAQPHTVDDSRILVALSLLHRELGVAAEPSGVVSATPILVPDPADAPSGGVHVAIISGGNVDPARLATLLANAEEDR